MKKKRKRRFKIYPAAANTSKGVPRKGAGTARANTTPRNTAHTYNVTTVRNMDI